MTPHPRKGRSVVAGIHLALSLAVIGLLQRAALAYGLWTVAIARPQVRARSRPLGDLKTLFPGRIAGIDTALASSSTTVQTNASVRYVPLVSRSVFWTALIDATTAEVIAFVPIDSF